jgi:hypothetical protein
VSEFFIPISMIDLTTIGTSRSKQASSNLNSGAIKHSSLYFFKKVKIGFIPCPLNAFLIFRARKTRTYQFTKLYHLSLNKSRRKHDLFLFNKTQTQQSQKNQIIRVKISLIIHIKFTLKCYDLKCCNFL